MLAWGVALCIGTCTTMSSSESGTSAYSEQALFDEVTGVALNERAERIVAEATGGGHEQDSACAAEAATLADVPVVQIAEGKWKYVQIELTTRSPAATLRIVRSYSGTRFHAEAFEKAMAELRPRMDVKGRVVGGGRIVLRSATRTIDVYGYSKTFGRSPGCNEHSADLIRAAYDGFAVTWSDKGY